MELVPGPAVYRSKKPKQASLWEILASSFDLFEQIYDSCCTKTYGFFPACLFAGPSQIS